MPKMDRQTDDHPRATRAVPRDPSRTLRAKRQTLARRHARAAKYAVQGREVSR